MDRILHLTQIGSSPNHSAPPLITFVNDKALDDEVIDIEEAQYVERYKLLLRFSNGVKRMVDFESFLKASTNPLIRKYLDLTNFKHFALECGNLHWNNYDLCFPVADLYAGQL